MLKSRINLFEQKWIDTVFEGRNKEYGAYDLRRRGSVITVISTVIGVLGFSFLVGLPKLLDNFDFGGSGRETIDEVVTLATILDTPPEELPKDIPQQQQKPEETTSVEIKRFTPPVVAPDEAVVEEIVSQKDLKDVIAGSKNVAATDDGGVVIDETPVEVVTAKTVTEDRTVHDQTSVEVQAQPPGGINAFRQYIAENLTGLTLSDGLTELRMEIKFVVEKSGALTDIQVLRDGGYPDIADQAVKVIGKAPKWSPAVMNGRPVRMSYRLPITIQVSN
ncbi:MAG: energy transducer TonB [Rikenellaceae bacterium]|jgi:protein TonB|nr:energy transducer TonB [Rikenellaceae bacterium]